MQAEDEVHSLSFEICLKRVEQVGIIKYTHEIFALEPKRLEILKFFLTLYQKSRYLEPHSSKSTILTTTS